MGVMTISLPIIPEANELLDRDPLALMMGMVLDQQIPLEKAFSSPSRRAAPPGRRCVATAGHCAASST